MKCSIICSAIFLLAFSFPASASWGTGATTGTLTSDTWTPGRDANNVVNLASWNLVPLNRWIQIAGTRLDGLDATVKAAQPGWVHRGNEGWNSVTDDWNGMAWDTRTDKERGWLAVAGGHDGGSNDGIYEFNLRQMNWRIQRLPQDNSWWPSSYNASYTNFTPAANYYAANPSNPEGVYNDEFYDPSNLPKSIRTPTARHTYGSQVFVPTLGDSGKLLMGCRRYWEYDFATNTWSLPKFPFGNQTDFTGERGYCGENMQGWWNETEGRYYVCATQNYGGSQAWSVVAGGTDWRWEGGYPVSGYQTFYTAQEKLRSMLYTLTYHIYMPEIEGLPKAMIVTNLDTRQKVSHDITVGSTFSTTTFTAGWWDGQGMTFVSSKGKWLCNVNTTAGMKFAWIDTTTWTLDSAEIGGSWPTSICTNLENKIKFFPDLNALIWVNKASENIRIVKLGTTSGVATEEQETRATSCNLWNAPQPFNPHTTISYQLPLSAVVTLSIIDARGRQISILERGAKAAGLHSIQWNGKNMNGIAMPSGMYFCQLKAIYLNGKKMEKTSKMLLAR